jgi:hypothetical protein
VPATITATGIGDGLVTLRAPVNSINNGANVSTDGVAVDAHRSDDTMSTAWLRINFLPQTDGKAAPHVTPLVVPILGEQRSGIFPSLVSVSDTPHASRFPHPAASKYEALS